MTYLTYLQRYAASTRQKVDMDLAERFDYSIRKDGDKPIRAQMAKARRAATTLKNLLEDFKDMPAKQIQELESSSKTLRKLASDLEGLARFAVGYQAFYLAEIKREEDDRLEAYALNRWGQDSAAVDFEWALILDLGTEGGFTELGQWMHAQGKHTSVSPKGFIPPFETYNLPGTDKRREAANALRNANNQFTVLSGNGAYCHVGMLDYEKFLADRKAAASVLNNVLDTARTGGL